MKEERTMTDDMSEAMKDAIALTIADQARLEEQGGYAKDMTLRDWFAGQMLAAMDDIRHVRPKWVALHAYAVADAMLAKRKGGDGESL